MADSLAIHEFTGAQMKAATNEKIIEIRTNFNIDMETLKIT
jgi:hypothetical protein